LQPQWQQTRAQARRVHLLRIRSSWNAPHGKLGFSPRTANAFFSFSSMELATCRLGYPKMLHLKKYSRRLMAINAWSLYFMLETRDNLSPMASFCSMCVLAIICVSDEMCGLAMICCCEDHTRVCTAPLIDSFASRCRARSKHSGQFSAGCSARVRNCSAAMMRQQQQLFLACLHQLE